jgi:hypothetical protein
MSDNLGGFNLLLQFVVILDKFICYCLCSSVECSNEKVDKLGYLPEV